MRFRKLSTRPSFSTLSIGLAFLIFLAISRQISSAQTVNTLHSFTAGLDGTQPTAPLVMDSLGNLYGTTQNGGASSCGTVFQVTPGGTEQVLYAFTCTTDGSTPYAGLAIDAQGNLYGTTLYGGSTNCGSTGCGVVFKVTTAGVETVLYSFQGGTDGFYPRGTLIIDTQGNLYGTTQYGGAPGSFGIVFKISPTGTETIRYRFAGYPNDGASPFAGLVRDAQGNLYGTTESGGEFDLGTVFEITSTSEKILHNFSGGADAYPWAGLVFDTAGNLYGTATGNFGEVFFISSKGGERILYTFTGGADGGFPLDGLIRGPGGFYGTTSQGGNSGNGTIFKVNLAGQETVVYDFPGSPGGAQPYAGLIGDAKGNGYGTTLLGGVYNRGMVFQIVP